MHPTIEVTIDLPFYLRAEDPLTVLYEEVCQEAQLPELAGHNLEITFSRIPAGPIDKSDWPTKERTKISIKVETPTNLSETSSGTFAIRNCLEILNKVITSYQATTGEVSNAGFIFPLGTSDMQLFADIRVNGQDIRDRWPSHSVNTFPLSADQVNELKRYLISQDELPLSRLFLTNSILSLERGQNSLAVLQAATAVELRMTQHMVGKLSTTGWSTKKITNYEKRPSDRNYNLLNQMCARSRHTLAMLPAFPICITN